MFAELQLLGLLSPLDLPHALAQLTSGRDRAP